MTALKRWWRHIIYDGRQMVRKFRGRPEHTTDASARHDQAIALAPDDPTAYCHRGVAFARKGKLDRAIADYDRAIALKSDFADAYVCRGIAYADRGDLERAISDFGQAVSIQPDDGVAYYNRAKTYADQGDLERAIVDWTLSIVFCPDDAKAYYYRGRAQALTSNVEGAISVRVEKCEMAPLTGDLDIALVPASSLRDKIPPLATEYPKMEISTSLSEHQGIF